MQLKDATVLLQQWADKGRVVFAHQDLALLFNDETPKTLSKSLARLVCAGVLTRACRGVYVNTLAANKEGRLLEKIVLVLRRGHYNYLSLESMLSEYGVISQVPIDRLTVMTTGRSGEYRTPYGVIELTHTRRSVADVLASTVKASGRPLRLALADTAWRDLKRVGRNTHLVDLSELAHARAG